jgi:hypothetical protein
MSTFGSDERDSRVLADVEALAGTLGARRMTPHTPAPPPAPVVTAPEPPRDVRALLRRTALVWMLWTPKEREP